MNRKVLIEKSLKEGFEQIKNELNLESAFLVCGNNCKKIKQVDELINNTKGLTVFSNFSANPKYDEICNGLSLFKKSGAKIIMAIGGGSAIDVAKAIKMFYGLNENKLYLTQELKANDVVLIAVPTTAGSGSETTRYSILYYKNVNQNVTHDDLIPKYAILDFELLQTLPIYQKKVTALDTLCHSVESHWSVSSTAESMEYSMQAMKMMIENIDAFLDNTDMGNKNMLKASYYSGKAINISKTTAAHAMAYKMTTYYNIAHGHAVFLGLCVLYKFMINNMSRCIDVRGKEDLHNRLLQISYALSGENQLLEDDFFVKLLNKVQLKAPQIKDDEIDMLADSVNLEKLGNFPIKLEKEEIKELYKQIQKL